MAWSRLLANGRRHRHHSLWVARQAWREHQINVRPSAPSSPAPAPLNSRVTRQAWLEHKISHVRPQPAPNSGRNNLSWHSCRPSTNQCAPSAPNPQPQWRNNCLGTMRSRHSFVRPLSMRVTNLLSIIVVTLAEPLLAVELI